jgi:hypothetical protein
MQAIVDRVEEDPTHLFAVTQGTHTLCPLSSCFESAVFIQHYYDHTLLILPSPMTCHAHYVYGS